MVDAVAPNRGQDPESGANERPRFSKLRAYISLTKPRVIELLLITTFPVMFLAERGIPNLWLVAGVLLGGSLSAGSANAFNCYLDRDIDRLMKRTSKRPLVTGELTDRQALVFAWALGIVSTLFLWLIANPLTAGLSVAAIVLYVVGYTMLLKRRTNQNIVWGGSAGCMPVLIGWAAVTNSLSWAPVVMFGIIFLWTPPHYWPLSMKYSEDYREAHVPMLGVERGGVGVGLQTILYAWATLACSLLLVPIAPMGPFYAVVAVLTGGWFVYETHRLYHRAVTGKSIHPMRVFHASISYLTLLFLAIAIDPLLPIAFH